MNPILAAIISFFFPGVGQMFQDQVKKGVRLLLIAIILGIILNILSSNVHFIFGIIGLLWNIYVAYDAYKEESVINWL